MTGTYDVPHYATPLPYSDSFSIGSNPPIVLSGQLRGVLDEAGLQPENLGWRVLNELENTHKLLVKLVGKRSRVQGFQEIMEQVWNNMKGVCERVKSCLHGVATGGQSVGGIVQRKMPVDEGDMEMVLLTEVRRVQEEIRLMIRNIEKRKRDSQEARNARQDAKSTAHHQMKQEKHRRKRVPKGGTGSPKFLCLLH